MSGQRRPFKPERFVATNLYGKPPNVCPGVGRVAQANLQEAGINQVGQLVGQCMADSQGFSGFLRENGGMNALNRRRCKDAINDVRPRLWHD